MMNRRDCVTSPGARSALRFATLAFVLALAPLPAQAANTPQHPALVAIQAAFKRCQLERDGRANYPCTGKLTDEVDAVLNRIYRKIVAGLEQSDKEDHRSDNLNLESLIASQRAWVRYREADCIHVGPDLSGSVLERLIIEDCQFQMRMDRAKVLYELYAERFPEIADKR